MAQWYRDRGYCVLARNWTCRSPEARGEIDIVAERDGVLVVCEVKTRSSAAYGGPAAAVGAAKQARLRRLALAFLRQAGTGTLVSPAVGPVTRPVTVRFDVAAVLDDRRPGVPASVHVIVNAF